MPNQYSRSPLRVKLPEFNGGKITNADAFPGMNYYTGTETNPIPRELIKTGFSGSLFSSVFSNNFNTYNSENTPRLARYVKSLNAFYYTFYKGIYIYNPSIERDGVLYEAVRSNISFSINGGSSFTIEDNGALFYEGGFYSRDLNEEFSLNGLDKTSANGNINIFLSPETSKNKDLVYFSEDGISSSSSSQFISSRVYYNANNGIVIPELNPGDFFGIYLRFDVRFSADSKPVDYAFINMSYDNLPTPSHEGDFNFGFRDNIPGKSFGSQDFIQSFSFKFTTKLNYFVSELGNVIDKIYDNYPPFFNDYREVESL
jgi:hypothetical protein